MNLFQFFHIVSDDDIHLLFFNSTESYWNTDRYLPWLSTVPVHVTWPEEFDEVSSKHGVQTSFGKRLLSLSKNPSVPVFKFLCKAISMRSKQKKTKMLHVKFEIFYIWVYANLREGGLLIKIINYSIKIENASV